MEPPASPLRVLVVDDCPDTTASLALLLESWGHEARTAQDGEEALRLAAWCPDVVLLDVAMPRMNGLEVARRLRALPGGEASWLVAVTGYCRAEDQERTRQAGFDLHLGKPVEPARLEALLAAYKEQVRQRPAALLSPPA
jgi:CheY-like chemotaxis protein